MDDEVRRVGLKINMKKTKVMRINAKDQELIMIDGQGIEKLWISSLTWELQFVKRDVPV